MQEEQIISYSTPSLRRAITARLSLLESLMQEISKDLNSRKTHSPRLAYLKSLFADLEISLSRFQQAYSTADLTPKEYRCISQAAILLDSVCCGVAAEKDIQSLCDKVISINPALKAYL